MTTKDRWQAQLADPILKEVIEKLQDGMLHQCLINSKKPTQTAPKGL